jgi:hypothetical protein
MPSRHNWLSQFRLKYFYLDEAQLKFVATLENMLIIIRNLHIC